MGSNFAEELKRVIVQAWPDMEPVKKIGSGAYGIVFECTKSAEGTGFTTKEAVKIIKIPRDIEEEYDDDCDMSPEEYFTALKDKAVSEIQVMDSLKGPHVVHINEYKVLNQSEQFGYYVLIRMDLLTNLKSVLNLHANDNSENAERMAIKVCRDMCDALQRCFERNMIHRDIKPENILMSEDGDFYLGDFGLARQFSNGTRNVSSRGTEDYMAPEVYLHGCNQLTDLYSLGLVLYRIVNHNHVLFYDEKNGTEGKDIAQNKRVSGQYQIPLPANCSENFGKIVVKMCAYNPEDRFQSIAEIRKALDSIDRKADKEDICADLGDEGAANVSADNTPSIADISFSSSDKESADYRGNYTQVNNQSINVNNITYTSNTTAAVVNGDNSKKGKNKKNRKVAIIAIIAAIILLGIGTVIGIMKIGKIIAKLENPAKVENTENIDKNISENDTIEMESENTNDSEVADSGQAILKLKMVESEGAEIVNGIEDTLGNKYDNALQLYGYGKLPYVTYYLNREYSRFVGDFSCLEYQTIDNDNSFRLEIYGDDESLLYSIDYTRSLAVTPIDIDVTGVEFLTIKISADWAGKGMGGIISNGMLYAK